MKANNQNETGTSSKWGNNIKVTIQGIVIVWAMVTFIDTDDTKGNTTSPANQSIAHQIINGKTETRTEIQIAKDEIIKFQRWEGRAAVKCSNWKGVTITTAKDNIQMTKDCRDFEQKREWRRQAEWNMQNK